MNKELPFAINIFIKSLNKNLRKFCKQNNCYPIVMSTQLDNNTLEGEFKIRFVKNKIKDNE